MAVFDKQVYVAQGKSFPVLCTAVLASNKIYKYDNLIYKFSFSMLFIRLERMKDREVMVVYAPCQLSPEERIKAKEQYDRAERAELIPIGNQMLFAKFVMTEGII